MKKAIPIFALLALGAVAPLIPQEETSAVQFAENQRRYLAEREVYMNDQKDIQSIPLEAVAKASVARENFEQKLIDKNLVAEKFGTIEARNISLIEAVNKLDIIKQAEAFVFGKEDFESCGAAPCSFDGISSYGSGQMNLDSTSKVNGTDSARCDITAADDGCGWFNDVPSEDEYWYQMTIFIPTGFTIGASGYLVLLSTGDGVGAPFYCNLEDYGVIRLVCDGDEMAYTDTGINVSLNTDTKLEFRFKIGAATGDLDIWVNNNTEASPDYNGSGTLNSGTQNITYLDIGGYHPDIVNDKFYDDVIIDTGFIGLGTAPTGNTLQSTLKGGMQVSGGGTLKLN